MTSKLLTENKLEQCTIVSDEAIAGYPASNLWNGNTASKAKFNSGTSYVVIDYGESISGIDFAGVAVHNLASASGSISYETGTSSSGPWSPYIDINPSLDKPQLVETNALSHRYARMSVTCTSEAEIGAFHVGSGLELPKGLGLKFIKPEFGYSYKFNVSKNSSRNPVSINSDISPISSNIVFDNYDPNWFKNNWVSLINDLVSRPFFLVWDYTGPSEEAFYGWIKGAPTPPRFNHKLSCSAIIKTEGFIQ